MTRAQVMSIAIPSFRKQENPAYLSAEEAIEQLHALPKGRLQHDLDSYNSRTLLRHRNFLQPVGRRKEPNGRTGRVTVQPLFQEPLRHKGKR